MRSWSTFGAQMNHGQTQTHKTHHSLDLVFSMFGHGACTQMSFCLGISKLGAPKFPKWGPLELLKPIMFFANLWLK